MKAERNVMELTQAEPHTVWELSSLSWFPDHRNELSFGGRGKSRHSQLVAEECRRMLYLPTGPTTQLDVQLRQLPSLMSFPSSISAGILQHNRGWSKGQKKKPCKRQLTDYFTSEISKSLPIPISICWSQLAPWRTWHWRLPKTLVLLILPLALWYPGYPQKQSECVCIQQSSWPWYFVAKNCTTLI